MKLKAWLIAIVVLLSSLSVFPKSSFFSSSAEEINGDRELFLPFSENYTEIEIIPHERYVLNGSSFNVSIYVTPQDGQDIDTVSTDLITFTHDIIRCNSISWGDLFEEKTFTILGKINNSNGTIINTVWGSQIPAEFPGTFLNMNFTAINSGFASIIIDDDCTGVARNANPLPFIIKYNHTMTSGDIILSNEYPSNQTTGQPGELIIHIDVNNTKSRLMNVSWFSNVSGIWRLLGVNVTVPNGTYHMSSYGVVESPYNVQVIYQCENLLGDVYHSNSCSAKDIGKIKYVKLYTNVSGTMRPIFCGVTNGSNYTGSGFFDITNDSMAPTVWKWTDIRNLDIYTNSSQPIKIIVTYDIEFGEGVFVDWSVNVSDAITWRNKSYCYITEQLTPVISNPYPYDVQTWLSYNPLLSVNVTDPNGDTMNISFWTNASGSWQQIGTTQTGKNGSYSQITSNFNQYNKTFYWRVIADDGKGNIGNMTYRVRIRNVQSPPINFSAYAETSTQISLDWVMPQYVDSVRIMKRTDRFPYTINDGLLIHNSSVNYTTDTFINPGVIYYYTAWSYNATDNSWSVLNSTVAEVSRPNEPTDFKVITYDYKGMNLSWTKGAGTNTTLIRRKIGSYPMNQSDGSFVDETNRTTYNDTGLGSNTTYYYAIWSHSGNAVYGLRFNNSEPMTGYGTAFINSFSSIYQPFTIPVCESLYLKYIHLCLGHYVNDYPSNSDSYVCRVYLEGENVGGLGIHEIYLWQQIGLGELAWRNISVPNIYLKGGGTYTIRVQGYHLCSPQCAYNPEVRWAYTPNGYTYKLFGNHGYYSTYFGDGSNTTDTGPPSVQTLKATNIGNYTATLKGYLLSDGGEQATCGFIWENDSGQQNTTVGSFQSGSYFELNITGLSPARTYNFTAWASNLNSFMWSSSLQFNTRPYPPSNISHTDNGNVNITWTIGAGSDRTIVRYKTGSYPASINDGTLAGNVTGNYTTIQNITSNTTYYVRAWGFNQTQSLYSSENVSYMFTSLVWTPVVNSLAVTNIDDVSAKLRASVVRDGGERCLCGFRWGTSPSSYSENVTVGYYTTGQTVWLNLSNLTIATTYFFQSWSENNAGFFNDTEEYFATKPIAPSGLTANNYGSRQINLSWSKDSGADTIYIKRQIGSYPSNVSSGTLVYNGSGISYVDFYLNESTSYYYRAWSYNATNGLFSNLNSSAYDTTDSLPIINLSPINYTNANRPSTITGTPSGVSPLTVRLYEKYTNQFRLGDSAYGGVGWESEWSEFQSTSWSTPEAVLDVNPNTTSYVEWIGWGYLYNNIYSEWLTVNLSKPELLSGVNLNYNLSIQNQSDSDIYIDVIYRDNQTNVEHLVHWQSSYWTEPTDFFFDKAVFVDQVRIRFGIISDNWVSGKVWMNYVGLYQTKELYNETVSSGTPVNYLWFMKKENHKYWWIGTVEDDTDIVAQQTWLNTEGMSYSFVHPENDSIVTNELNHMCSVQLNHSGGDTMNVSFYYKNLTTGQFIFGGSNNSVGNGTYQWIYPNSNQLSTTYTWRVIANDSMDEHNESFIFTVRGANKPVPPIFNVTVVNTTLIQLHNISWDNQTDTLMVRIKETGYPSNITDGVLLFNASVTMFNHSGLLPASNHYYSMWAYNMSDDVWSNVTNGFGKTFEPSVDYSLVRVNSTVINITNIIMNNYTTSVLIRAKIGSYPANRSDGEFVLNGTVTNFSHIGLQLASEYYYSAWAYDEPDNYWSSAINKRQKTNGPPYLSNFNPSNGGLVDGVNPVLQVTIDEYNNDYMNVTFRSNVSGSWQVIKYFNNTYKGKKEYISQEFSLQNTRYWWSVNVTDGEFWTNETLSFLTTSLSVPSNFSAEAYNTSVINVSWKNGNGTTGTYVVRKNASYPDNMTDGDIIYNGTGEFVLDVGLDYSKRYYYKAWSYNETLNVFSLNNITTCGLTKPFGPTNMTASTRNWESIELAWKKGLGSNNTIIKYLRDKYPTNFYDGTVVYNGTGNGTIVTGLSPDDVLNFVVPYNGTDNFGIYPIGGDQFNNSCDGNISTKWDLNASTTGNFSYRLDVPQRVYGIAILFQDFYNQSGADWEASITKIEVFNGSWHTAWEGNLYNTKTDPEWWNHTFDIVYYNTTEIRLSAWTEYITPNIYEVQIGKLGYVHCFKAWGYVGIDDLWEISDEAVETWNRTDDTPPNNPPNITAMYPLNGSTNLDLLPALNITIFDVDGQKMNISWMTNISGDWVIFNQTILVGNGTYNISPPFFDGYNTTYYWRVNVSDTSYIGESALVKNYMLSDIVWFRTRERYIPEAPISFDASDPGMHTINLSWAIGLNGDRVVIERNTSSPWSLGQGIVIYNGTGTFYQDYNLDDNTTFYYQIWSFNETDDTYSTIYLSDNETTLLDPNIQPDKPFNEVPANNTDYSTVYLLRMNVTVSDKNLDVLTVSFYWNNYTLIGSVMNVSNGSVASLYLPDVRNPYWLKHDTTYYWYANATDGELTNQSDIWSFHTSKAWDVNEDRYCNYLDASAIVLHYGEIIPLPGQYGWDIVEDAEINYLDVSLMVLHYGESY